MIKYASADSQLDLLTSCEGRLSQYLSPHDRVKSACSDVITGDVWRDNMPDDRHFGVHTVIYGCTPHYLYNRNSDAIDDESTVKKVATFVSHGAVYEEHRHGLENRKGVIKVAKFNPKLHRAELIVHISKDAMPEAYERAKAGKELGFSMGCKIAGDVSECCGHFARTPANQCSHMIRRRKQYIPERRKYAFVWNPNPTFFDASVVKRPACRVAYYLSYRLPEGEKMASVNHSTSELNAASILPVKLASDGSFGKYAATAERLLALETQLNTEMRNGVGSFLTKLADTQLRMKQCHERITESDLTVLRELRVEHVLTKLSSERAILAPREFFAYMLNRDMVSVESDDVVRKAVELTPFSIRLAHEFDFGEYDVSQFDFDGSVADSNHDYRADDVISKLARQSVVSVEQDMHRVILDGRFDARPDSIDLVKIANHNYAATNTDCIPAKALAATYGLYQIAASHSTHDESRNVLMIVKKGSIWN